MEKFKRQPFSPKIISNKTRSKKIVMKNTKSGRGVEWLFCMMQHLSAAKVKVGNFQKYLDCSCQRNAIFTYLHLKCILFFWTEQPKSASKPAEVDSYGAPLAEPVNISSYPSTQKPQYLAAAQSQIQSADTTKATISSSSSLDVYEAPSSTPQASDYKAPSTESYFGSLQSGSGSSSGFPGPDFWNSFGLKPNLELDFDKIKSKFVITIKSIVAKILPACKKCPPWFPQLPIFLPWGRWTSTICLFV